MNHLSRDQLAKCLIDQPSRTELQHIAECAACRGELSRFRNAVSLFRNAIRDRVDARVAWRAPRLARIPNQPLTPVVPLWRWALVVVAAVVLVVVPLLKMKKAPQDVESTSIPMHPNTLETNPDALMNAVNLHLSRTVPAPMERMILAIPEDESKNESGGVQ